jgi:hypothetical protein
MRSACQRRLDEPVPSFTIGLRQALSRGSKKVRAGRLPIPPGSFFGINLNTDPRNGGKVVTTTNHSQNQHFWGNALQCC